jgi:hypothetical protein
MGGKSKKTVIETLNPDHKQEAVRFGNRVTKEGEFSPFGYCLLWGKN